MKHLCAPHPAHRHLQQIRTAADRAAALTRQLLSFSRQQVLELRALNLNEVIAELTKLLSHMIGEDVSLVFRPAKELGSVRADPGQVEQILMNLAVNARDAMPRGGSLAMETCNIDVDEHNAWQHTMVKHGATSENGNGKERSPPPQRLFQSSPESDISKSQRIKAYPGARLAIPAGHALSAVAQPWKMASR
jgi:nitrogen-specific signal transduction histidine kinase